MIQKIKNWIKSHPKLQWFLKGSKEALRSAFWGNVVLGLSLSVIGVINVMFNIDTPLLWIINSLDNALFGGLAVIIYGILFSLIPVTVGGGILGLIIYLFWNNERISKRKGVLFGASLGGISVISISLLILCENRYWHGTYDLMVLLAIIATIIGFIAGGWTGKRLVLSLIGEPSFDR